MNLRVSIRQLIKEIRLETVYMPPFEGYIENPEINRPGLQMIGYFEHFDNTRIQIFGTVESSYLNQMTISKRKKALENLFKRRIPAVLITRGAEISDEMIDCAEEYQIPILRSVDDTSAVINELVAYLNLELAKNITRHGVLVEVYGEGVLILGKSGVGKSETALELIKRGHRLVADDAVEIKRVSAKALVGSSPEAIRHFIELRGIGIIDVKQIFGMGSVKNTEKIDIVVHLEPWEDGKQYDRLGLVAEYTNILGIDIPSHTVPVKPGRNLAVIFEVAAMNNRQKKMGYNAAAALNERIMQLMSKASDGAI